MKRYWKLFGMTLAILLCIGTFYTNLALSESRLPSIALHTQFGDKKELGDFVIRGIYMSGNSTRTLKLDQNGSRFISHGTFLSQLSNNGLPLTIQDLQKKYRNFMRGKSGSLTNFYEDQNKLVYSNFEGTNQIGGTGPNDFTLEIAILDKREPSHPATHFTIPIRVNTAFENVEDVQLVGNEVKIVTNSSTGNGDNEIHLYSVNVSKQKLDGDLTLFSQSQKTNVDSGYGPVLQVITQSDALTPSKYIVVLENSSSAYNPELFLVNLLSGKKEQVTLPKGIKQQVFTKDTIGETSYLTGTKLELIKATEQGLTLYPYDIMTKELGRPVNVDFTNESSSLPMLTFKNDKVYILTNFDQAKENVCILENLETGTTLYKGKIEAEKGKLKVGQDKLSFQSIEVR